MNALILKRTGLYALISLVTTLQAVAQTVQEKPIDNALLWRVTGKSLLKPSFLYGTIHLTDQRVFNFNDSLYSFIKAADGFAMEIHPDSVISALMAKEEKEEASGKMLKQQLSKEDFNQLSRKLRKELGVDANKLTLKEAYLLRDHLTKPTPKDDDMPTFVDAYLFGMARNQGKEIVGLEKAGDQVNMLDDIEGDFDIRELLKNVKKEKTFTERLVQLYIREDLQAIHSLMSYMPDEMEDKLLNLRNQVMAQKMDSLIQSKSFVVAVGTAHLPGKKGIIELLRSKGYTVEPVFTTTRTHANTYAVKAEQKYIWVDVNEPQLGYSMRMPGKPNPMDMMNGGMKMNMYMDLASMKVYYAAFVIPSITVTKQNADSVLQAMCKNAMASSKGQTISKTRFTEDKFEGIDFVYKQVSEKMYARVQAFAMGKRIYLVGFGSPRQQDLNTPEADDYFKNFTLLDMPENTWEAQTFTDHHFTVSLPAKARLVQLPITDSSVRSVQFNAMDNKKGAYYGLTVVTANAGYVIPNDSTYFADGLQRLRDNMDMDDVVEKDTTFRGFNAKYITARVKETLRLTCFMINRGNRVYNVTAIVNLEDSANADVPAFLNSFSFTDYPKLQWQPRTVNQYGFAAPVTNDFTKVNFLDSNEDSVTSTREYQWVAYDSTSATSFYVTRRLIPTYLWVKHDSVLLKKYMKELTAEDEILLDYKFVRNGGSNGIEFNIKRPSTSLGQRIRVLLNGQAVYTLQTDVPYAYWKDGYQKFLEDFRFAKEEKPSFLYTNSLQRLLKDLTSTDSATHMNAFNEIEQVIYDSTDIPALLRAACTEYALDSLHYITTAESLFDAIFNIEHAKKIEMLTAHYNSLKAEQEQYKFRVLEAVAGQRNEQSYAVIEKLLKQGVPTKGDPGDFVISVSDSLALARKLFPYIVTLTADTLLGPALFYMYDRLLDSSAITVNELKPYEPLLMKSLRYEMGKSLSSKKDYYYSMGLARGSNVLQALNTDSSRAMLRRMLQLKHINLKYDAAISLLEMNQPVDAATLLSIAADKGYRAGLYARLKDMNKEQLFPAKYLTQKYLAESHASEVGDDEGAEKTVFAGERAATYKGKKYRFFLYKAIFEYDGTTETYLCVAGAFSLDSKKFAVDEELCGIYWEEEFSQSSIDKHLKAYIASREEEAVEDEEE